MKMFGGIDKLFDPGKFLNNMLDQVLPGQIGDIVGDMAGMALDSVMGNYLGALSNFQDFFTNMSELFQGGLQDFLGEFGSQISEPGSFPSFSDTPDPAGHLAVEGNKVTTPGGYEIENLGGTKWKITSPNGKETVISGDPHVREGDGTVWHWDQATKSFVLPDGTKITANATGKLGVTTDLDIYYGNERVHMDGVNTSNPTTSVVTYDAAVHDKFHDDGSVAFLGGDGDDWFQAGADGVLREITGGGGNNPLTFGKELWFDAGIKQAAQLAGQPWMGDEPVVQGGGGAGGAEGAGKLDFWDMMQQIEDDKKRTAARAAAAGMNPANMSLEDLIMMVLSRAIRSQADKVMEKAKKIDAKGDDAKKTDDIELQMAVQRLSRLFQTLTNIIKQLHQAKEASVRNMK
jgi:hypothetical protein